MVNKLLLSLSVFVFLSPVWGANILGLFSTFSPSHLLVHMSIMKSLADQGHNVTIVTNFKPKLAPHDNITLILAPASEERMRGVNQFVENSMKRKPHFIQAIFNTLTLIYSIMGIQYDFVLHPQVKDIYENPHVKYDLLVLGYLFNDFQLGIAAKLQVPAILSWVGLPLAFVDDTVGNVYDPSYVPIASFVTETTTQSTGLWWRMHNLFSWTMLKIFSVGNDFVMAFLYKHTFGNDSSMITYDEAKEKVSLLFYNYHSQSEGPVRPTVPQSIEIGGIQIKEQRDSLPQELAYFLGNATDGAIFFSLGTNIKLTFFEPQLLETIYQVLSHQQLRVIWKWDDQVPKPGNASNINFHNWLPQDDILAHPNTKLFITHAGKGGVAEAQYHGVPMLALPVFTDQPGNAQLMVASGFGISMDLLTLTKESLEKSIQEVLNNPVYRNNVRKFSDLYRDRPLTARQSVIYWTEYVMRHKGAYHLRSPIVKLGFVARYNLDVYAILLLIFVCSIIIFVFLLRFLVNTTLLKTQSKAKIN
ncbi:UDP-glycosyltransferase UGT5-like [Drosophila sulfurigaster albostrigata]|uniref:UDP-glycosyltransferase UGT5-like n=1 Tax=Drosophila sulfurigaster albostrigata TaxID=89887 RepID=UPI002D21E6B9|nr:UDP-glycosyltransferase UGT5-like [Drosophila sulfurigaster albostrigata]